MEFSETTFRKRFRIQRYLVRQWILVCVSSRGAWFDGAATVVVPQLQFIVGRRFCCRGAVADSPGSLTTVVLQLQYIDTVVDVCCACPVLECSRG